MSTIKTGSLTLLCLLTASSAMAMGKAPASVSTSQPQSPAALTPHTAESIKTRMNLSYLQLTPEQVRERDKKLAPIYDYYRDARIGKVTEEIESTFATNVYHYQSMENNLYVPSLKDKESTMDSVIRYYTGFEVKGTPFENASAEALPGKNSVQIIMTGSSSWNSETQNLGVKRVDNDDKYFNATGTMASISLVATEKSAYHGSACLGFCDKDRYAIFTSTLNHLFEVPVLDHFLTAMKETNIRALDATVVFAAGEVKDPKDSSNDYDEYGNRKGAATVPYQVVYPTLSRMAPIPQPVVFISQDASELDIEKMLKEHAPRIYAYDQLFNANLLPQIEDLDRALAQYPELMDAVLAANKQATHENGRAALNEAFLDVAYGMLAAGMAPVALAAALASPVLMPIIVSQVTVVTVIM